MKKLTPKGYLLCLMSVISVFWILRISHSTVTQTAVSKAAGTPRAMSVTSDAEVDFPGLHTVPNRTSTGQKDDESRGSDDAD